MVFRLKSTYFQVFFIEIPISPRKECIFCMKKQRTFFGCWAQFMCVLLIGEHEYSCEKSHFQSAFQYRFIEFSIVYVQFISYGKKRLYTFARIQCSIVYKFSFVLCCVAAAAVVLLVYFRWFLFEKISIALNSLAYGFNSSHSAHSDRQSVWNFHHVSLPFRFFKCIFSVSHSRGFCRRKWNKPRQYYERKSSGACFPKSDIELLI